MMILLKVVLVIALVLTPTARAWIETGVSATATCNCTSLTIDQELCHSEVVKTSTSSSATITQGGVATMVGAKNEYETGLNSCLSVPIAPGKCVYYKYVFTCEFQETFLSSLGLTSKKKVCALVSVVVKERDPVSWEC